MTTRRTMLIGLGFAPFVAAAARAEDWRAQFHEVRFGVSSAENERDAVARHEPLARYLSQRLGVAVRIFRSADYAGLVEAMRSGNLEFAGLGPANYALARRVMGERVVPVATMVDNESGAGYHSIIVVRADSPYHAVADLRGRRFAYADPNSTSGYVAPVFYLRREGIDPEHFFSQTAFSGSHENSVIAVLNGTFDAAATFWNNEERGNVQRMVEKGMIPANSIRIIWTSPLIPNSPYVVRADLPEELKQLFTQAMLALPTEGAEAWQALANGTMRGLIPARHEDYIDLIAIVEEQQAQRRRRTN
jgi:phosphonate transport system substrate-binding protein